MYPEAEAVPTGGAQGNPSFARDMLRNFEEVCKYSEEGLKTAKDVASLFKKQQEVEAQYAKGMAKLAQNFRSLVPEDKRTYLPPPGAPPGETPSLPPTNLCVALFNVIDRLQFTSRQHDHLSVMLGQMVVEPLQAAAKDLEAARKQLTQEGQKQNRTLREAYTVLKRAEMSHAQSQKEATDIASDRDKAQNNFLSKSSTLSKLQDKASAAQTRAASVSRMLEERKAVCVSMQRQHYDVALPRILKAMEMKELARCSALLKALQAANLLETEACKQQLQSRQTLDAVFQSVDLHADTREFIMRAEESTGRDVPITAILSPTLKGHMACRSWSSGKGWRDHVLVLVREQHRLYRYEADNAQVAKSVLTLPMSPTTIRPVDDSLFECNRVFQVVTDQSTLYIRAPNEAMFRLWQQTLKETCMPQAPLVSDGLQQPFTVVRCLTLKVSEAKDLPKSGEHFALVLLDSEKQAKTLTKGNTNSPYWNQSFSFDDVPADVANVTVEVHRDYSSIERAARKQASALKSRMGKLSLTGSSGSSSTDATGSGDAKATRAEKERKTSELVGVVKVPLAALSHAGPQSESWHVISSSHSTNNGSIRLGVTYTEELVRPVHEYADLERLFSPDTCAPLVKVLDQAISPLDRQPMGVTLVGIAHHDKRALDFLLLLCRIEIQGTTEPQTLFRGNSLASKALDDFMKVVAVRQGTYLETALGMPVQTVYDLKQSCESDPTRLTTSDTAKEGAANMKRLLYHTGLFWQSILHSLDHVPVELRYIFKHLRAMLAEKFDRPGSTTPPAADIALAGFFFLRLITPAIMGPQLFGLQSHQPDKLAARTLTLISKTIQNLSNGVMFGQKEPHMRPLNEFLTGNAKGLQECFRALCTAPETVEVGMTTLERPRLLASLHRILFKNLDALRSVDVSASSTPSEWPALLEEVERLRRPPEELVDKVKTLERTSSFALRRHPMDSQPASTNASRSSSPATVLPPVPSQPPPAEDPPPIQAPVKVPAAVAAASPLPAPTEGVKPKKGALSSLLRFAKRDNTSKSASPSPGATQKNFVFDTPPPPPPDSPPPPQTPEASPPRPAGGTATPTTPEAPEPPLAVPVVASLRSSRAASVDLSRMPATPPPPPPPVPPPGEEEDAFPASPPEIQQSLATAATATAGPVPISIAVGDAEEETDL